MANWEEIGFGQEAQAFKGELKEIEGIGGIVKSEKPITLTKRKSWGNPYYEYQGHDLFCKHLCARLLDELFLREGKYTKAHIPIPVGSFNGGYYYQFAEGTEGFPLEIMVDNCRQPVRREEWNIFAGLFNEFGFKVHNDIADASDGRTGKNIIFLPWDIEKVYDTAVLHADWKRIDFGAKSCAFDYEKYLLEIAGKRQELADEYGLAVLAAQYYGLHENSKELEELVLRFREKRIQSLKIKV